MTTEAGATEGTEEAAREAALSSQDDGHDWETEARDMGWVPEAEFKGNKRPERFKTAQEFVEDIPPYVKKLLERQEAKFAERIGKFERVNDKTMERLGAIHKKELAEARAAKREAIETGDIEAVEKIDAQIDKLRDEAPLNDDPKAQRAKAEKAFADANPWYGVNRKMTAFARGLSQDLAAAAEEAGKPMSYEDNIKQVLAEVRTEFPEQFEKKPAANGHAAVDGGSNEPSRSSPLAKFSADERAKAKEDMKKFPTIYPTEQSWLEAYQAK